LNFNKTQLRGIIKKQKHKILSNWWKLPIPLQLNKIKLTVIINSSEFPNNLETRHLMIAENGAVQSSSFLNQFKKMHKTITCWNAISKLLVVDKCVSLALKHHYSNRMHSTVSFKVIHIEKSESTYITVDCVDVAIT